MVEWPQNNCEPFRFPCCLSIHRLTGLKIKTHVREKWKGKLTVQTELEDQLESYEKQSGEQWKGKPGGCLCFTATQSHRVQSSPRERRLTLPRALDSVPEEQLCPCDPREPAWPRHPLKAPELSTLTVGTRRHQEFQKTQDIAMPQQRTLVIKCGMDAGIKLMEQKREVRYKFIYIRILGKRKTAPLAKCGTCGPHCTCS